MNTNTLRNGGVGMRAGAPYACVLLVASAAAGQMRLDEFVLKGTHNSYSTSSGNTCPVMSHHPVHQIDDFGVWAIELDFDIVLENGEPRAYVGHDCVCGAGCWTHPYWGPYLGSHAGTRGYFERIRDDARAFRYRPVLIYLEKKYWSSGDCDHGDWNVAGGDTCCWGQWLWVVVRDLRNVFGDGHVLGPRMLREVYGGSWPPVAELAGMVIPVAIHGLSDGVTSDWLFAEDDTGQFSAFLRRHADECVTLQTAQGQAAPGVVLGFDQYQYDWTFYNRQSQSGWGSLVPAPPNPLCVDAAASSSFEVRNDAEDHEPGDPHKQCWNSNDCSDCRDNGGCTECCFQVSRQGTFRFPYATISAAVDRAEAGWTILIKPGAYPGSITISKAVTLEADGGTVTIGGQ